MKPETPMVVFDTEFTTWQGAMERNWSGAGEKREIIQIGALLLDGSFREIARFERLVKPVFNPELSDYCVNLTGIKQERLEKEGVGFATALLEFREFVGPRTAWSYGRDCDVLAENCDWRGIRLGLDRFGDIRDIVAATGCNPRDWTSGTLHALAGKPRPGDREHDACDDCLSIAAFLRWRFSPAAAA